MKRIGLWILVILLTGCETVPLLSPHKQETDSAAWRLHKQQLNALEVWKLQGRMVLIAGDDGWTATLHWDQDHQRYDLRFIAPMGQGTYQLRGSVDSVTLTTAENEELQASDPETLLQENLGWNIPLGGLKYWIRGLPDPAVTPECMLLDDAGRLSDLQQSGWDISIQRYMDVDGLDLPGKLVLKNARFQLRLVIQAWQTT